MKYAADFRQIARDRLRGKWGIAVLAGFLAALLGAVESNTPTLNFEIENGNVMFSLEMLGQTLFPVGDGPTAAANSIFSGLIPAAVLLVIVSAVALLILGSVLTVGYSRFNLDLVDGRGKPEVNILFAYFPHWKNAVVTSLLQGLYIFLWSLLFIIPGIVASYSYAMTGYILAENPQLTASEAIYRSKEMMRGNRGRLFCLHLSFIGWAILSAFTMGIGDLWLMPYRQAASAAFYRDVSGAAQAKTVNWEYE